MRHLVYVLLLLHISFAATAADNEAELKKLYDALNMLNQQQQAVHQQFRMVQELRAIEGARMLYGTPMTPQLVRPVANYEELVAAQQRAAQREESLHRQADQLLDTYNEIEELKKPLHSRIYELTLKGGQD
jgi:predicted LPLAT superfamily acyltransferase